MPWKGLELIESMTIDYERDELEVRTTDGRVVRQKGGARSSSRPDAPFDFKRVAFRPADLLTTMVTTLDEELEVEVFVNDDHPWASFRASDDLPRPEQGSRFLVPPIDRNW